MGFWTRPGPWVEVIVVCLRSELLDEAVCSLPRTPKGSEGDGHEVEVELLVLDDLAPSPPPLPAAPSQAIELQPYIIIHIE